MNTGPSKDIKKSQLTMKLEQMQAEQEDLISSSLESFRNDLKVTAESALAIIKTDTEGYLLRVRKHLMRQSANIERPNLKAMFWPMMVAFCLIISVSVTLWTIQDWLRPSMSSMGVQIIEQQTATFLIPTSQNVTITRCSLAGQQVNCLKIEKE